MNSKSGMQTFVRDFLEKYQLQTDAKNRYIDLVSEVGELGKEILVSTKYGKKELEVSKEMAEEMGDCLFSMLALCEALGVNAEDVLRGALSKYEDRFRDKGDVGSGE